VVLAGLFDHWCQEVFLELTTAIFVTFVVVVRTRFPHDREK